MAVTYYTADLVRALPDDGRRYEVVHGELLVTPAPQAAHQLVVRRLSVTLSLYAERHRAGQVFDRPRAHGTASRASSGRVEWRRRGRMSGGCAERRP
jgi:hypothetical protein